MNIDLPNNWIPRDYQQNLWSALKTTKRSFVVWPRRHGKDDVMLHHNACSAFERVGNYWYMLPKYTQCRKAIWEAVNPATGKLRIDEAFPHAIRAGINNQEMRIPFLNGSSFQVMGSDNSDALVGSPPIGLTFSEYALSNPSSWGYLRPILLENGGWAAFNTTPRGKNHAYRLMNLAEKSEDWFFELLTSDQTGLYTPLQLQIELEELSSEHGETYGKALWLQEYFCSFDAALPGSIWGEATSLLQSEGRLKTVPHTKGYPVHGSWDLGKDDDTAIWFYQVVENSLNIIDYHEKNFKDVDYYAEYLRDHGQENEWRYGAHWLPHDARPDRMGQGGKTILQQFIDHSDQIELEDNYKIGSFAITPSFSKQDGIQAARKTFKVAQFDKSRCEVGFDHLKAYTRKYDEKEKTFSEEPKHDLHSHASDSFRYLALTWKKSKKTQIVVSDEQKLINGNIIGITYGQLAKQHFKNKKRERNSLWR